MISGRTTASLSSCFASATPPMSSQLVDDVPTSSMSASMLPISFGSPLVKGAREVVSAEPAR